MENFKLRRTYEQISPRETYQLDLAVHLRFSKLRVYYFTPAQTRSASRHLRHLDAALGLTLAGERPFPRRPAGASVKARVLRAWWWL